MPRKKSNFFLELFRIILQQLNFVFQFRDKSFERRLKVSSIDSFPTENMYRSSCDMDWNGMPPLQMGTMVGLLLETDTFTNTFTSAFTNTFTYRPLK